MGCGDSKPKEDATQGRPNPNTGRKKPKQQQRQPVHEKGWKKRIRENMRNAAAGDDIEHLEKCMQIFINNNLDDAGDLGEAQRRHDFLLTRKDIRDACMRNHPEVLDKAIQRVEASPYRGRLKSHLDRAYYLKQQQVDNDTFRHDDMEMDQATVSEIRSYHHPPQCVHHVMMSVYMILGKPEEQLVDWTDITALMGTMGKHSLLREIDRADTRQVSNRVALRARNYLGMHTLDEVRTVSSGAATFYLWASEKVGHQTGQGDNDDRHNTQAAHVVGNRAGGKSSKIADADLEPLPLVNTLGKGRAPGGHRNKPEPSGTPPPVDKKKTKAKKDKKNTQPQAKNTQAKNAQNKAADQNQAKKGAKGNKVDPRDTNGKGKSTKKG